MKLNLSITYYIPITLFQLHRSNSVVFSHVIMRVIVFSTTIFAPKDEYISAN